MSKSSHFSFQQKLILRRMKRGASLRRVQDYNYRLGKNTLVDRSDIDVLVGSGHLQKTKSMNYILIKIGESDG